MDEQMVYSPQITKIVQNLYQRAVGHLLALNIVRLPGQCKCCAHTEENGNDFIDCSSCALRRDYAEIPTLQDR